MIVAALAEARARRARRTPSVLLASELCENAVLHAGTEFDVDPDASTTPRSPWRSPTAAPGRWSCTSPSRAAATAGPPRTAAGCSCCRAARHGVGHPPRAGRPAQHLVLASRPREPASAARAAGSAGRTRTAVPELPSSSARWLLHVPPALAGAARRRASWSPSWCAGCARCSTPTPWSSRSTRATAPGRERRPAGPRRRSGPGGRRDDRRAAHHRTAARHVLRVAHHDGAVAAAGLRGPRRAGRLPGRDGRRVAWLRDVDQRRRAWMTYLAETSELLGQSLDVELTVAVVPQVVVPRLGRWCAVHLLDDAGRLRLAALTHADEDAAARAARGAGPGPRPACRRAARGPGRLLAGDGSARCGSPRRPTGSRCRCAPAARTIGTLSSAGPTTARTAPRTCVLAGDIARRAALAIHNAQATAAHVAVSQALQQALLPRALPVVAGPGLRGRSTCRRARGSDVGGDFYDVLTVDPARWLVVDRRRLRQGRRAPRRAPGWCATCCGCWCARAGRCRGPSSCSTR